MKRLVWLVAVFLLSGIGITAPAGAEDVMQPAPCYWCIRDAIYDDARFIAHREANPDIDEAVKGPEITAARADIHRLRRLLGPPVQTGPEPCCYAREPLRIR